VQTVQLVALDEHGFPVVGKKRSAPLNQPSSSSLPPPCQRDSGQRWWDRIAHARGGRHENSSLSADLDPWGLWSSAVTSSKFMLYFSSFF